MATLAQSSRKAARSYQVLDPRTMGRPVHLLGRYTERLRKELTEFLYVRFNRRYRAQFEIGALTFEPATPDLAYRWLTFTSDMGRIAFAAERNVLLCILGYRYGATPAESGDPAQAQDVNQFETATEERLAARLGRQLVDVAANAIEALQPEGREAGSINVTAPPDASPAQNTFSPVAGQMTEAAWTLRVRVTERAHGLDGSVWFRFDEAWIERLMRGLAPHQRSSSGIPGMNAQPLPARLQLTLHARLVDKPIELGTLLDLRVGDVIPITLASTDVLIGDARLFTASIAEHKGKLCLTCFEDVE